MNKNATMKTFNTSLLILVCLLAVWAAFLSNAIATKEYRENLLKEKLSKLEIENNALVSQKSHTSDLGSLLVFGKEAGLVEQRNIEYIFENKDVAQAR